MGGPPCATWAEMRAAVSGYTWTSRSRFGAHWRRCAELPMPARRPSRNHIHDPRAMGWGLPVRSGVRRVERRRSWMLDLHGPSEPSPRQPRPSSCRDCRAEPRVDRRELPIHELALVSGGRPVDLRHRRRFQPLRGSLRSPGALDDRGHDAAAAPPAAEPRRLRDQHGLPSLVQHRASGGCSGRWDCSTKS